MSRRKVLLSALILASGLLLIPVIIYLRHWAGDYNYPPLTKIVRYPAVIIFTVMFIGYGLFIKAGGADLSGRKKIALFSSGLLFGVFLCSIYPILSIDLFEYIMRGRILSLYHANPYVQPPIDFPQDPLNKILFWKYQPMIYGPVWAYCVSAVVSFTRDSIFFSQFFIKFLLLMFHIATSFFMFRLAKDMSLPKPYMIAQAYLLNPFILIMNLMEGHQDAAMIFFLVASILCLFKNRIYIAIFLLTLSGLVKYIPFLFLPFYLVYIYFQQDRKSIAVKKILVSVFISSLTVFVMYAPVWEGTKIFSALTIVGTGFDTNTLPYLLYKGLLIFLPTLPRDLFRYSLYAAFAAVYLSSLVYLAKVNCKKQGLVNSILLIFSAYILFGAFQLGAWYFIWPVTFLLLSTVPLKYHFSALLSYAALISFWKRLSLLICAAVVVYVTMVINNIRRKRAD